MSPPKTEAMKRIRKTKNRIRAIPDDAAAIPPNPNAAATIATTRKISVQRNMIELHIPKSVF